MPKTGMEPIRREEILTATLRCIASDGLDKITLESIARKANVSKGIISYYFKNKQDVILNAYKMLLEGYGKALKEIIPHTGTMKELFYCISNMIIKEDITHFIPGMSQKEFRSVLIQFYSMMALNEEFRAMVRPIYQGYLESYKEIIREGIKRNEFREGPDALLAYGLLAQMDGLILYNIMGFSLPSLSMEETAHKLVDLWLD